jgi:hypothetical protein
MKPPELFQQLRCISPHLSAVLGVLKGIRAKIEFNRGQQHRINKHFNSLKGIILTGGGGTGKTTILHEIFYGLGLDYAPDGKIPPGIWLQGGSTTVGRREKFKEHGDRIIVWDEINVNDLPDVRLLKQITEGKITHFKWGDTESADFTGLIIGTTNDFSAKGRVGRDLEGLLDRLDIIEVGPPDGYSAEGALEGEYYKHTNKVPNWKSISTALRKESDVILTHKEIQRIKPFWQQKVRESLGDRVLTRSGMDYVDCLIFCKRFFGNLDNDYVFDLAVQFANHCVNLSAVSLSNLKLAEKDVIRFLREQPDKTAVLAEINTYLQYTGRYTSDRQIFRTLNALIEQGLIVRHKHGTYSMLRPNTKNDETLDVVEKIIKRAGEDLNEVDALYQEL